MADMPKQGRNPLLPWLISLPLILAAVIYVGYRFMILDCAIPGTTVFVVLALVPAVYLALMYLVFKSKD